ncbi:unnamed protein product [Trichogramma brassicae]|uniref:Peptidase S1 domain-containing protein n=1 Tax=Trichogramma brassicae TaxID=86971 RepID=A0A6H5IEV3_9HYME|nr:unnamed protein product [Trichogramma brassicae]
MPLRLVPNFDCYNASTDNEELQFANDIICTTILTEYDSCEGDIGSALVDGRKNVIRGIASSGDDFCDHPDIFINVTDYLDYIKMEISSDKFSGQHPSMVFNERIGAPPVDRNDRVEAQSSEDDDSGSPLWVKVLTTIFVVAEGPHSKIYQGEAAAKGEFPYQVSITVGGRHTCGGSLVSAKHVLTAAHCVEEIVLSRRNFTRGVAVRTGSVMLGRQRRCTGGSRQDHDLRHRLRRRLLLRRSRSHGLHQSLVLRALHTARDDVLHSRAHCHWPQSRRRLLLNRFHHSAFSETEADCDLDLSIAKTERELKKDTSFCTKSADCKAARLGDPVTKDDVVVGVVSRLPTGADCLTEPMVNTQVSKFLDYVNEELTTFTQNPADKSKLAKSIYIENDGEQTLCQYFFGWLFGEDSEEDDNENEVDSNEDAEDEESEEDYLDIFGLFGNALRRPTTIHTQRGMIPASIGTEII